MGSVGRVCFASSSRGAVAATTTDTNRTVDIVRNRGAKVIAIVNRRGSDLTDRADGVLYTSDGRDVEMSVASTKAFYSQIAAGLLLSIAITDELLGDEMADDRADLLKGITELPAAMETVLGRRDIIGEAARQFAPSRRYWAMVGNGPNRIAAQEVRVKLSELCYKSIAADSTEDKKHIDLSSEPLIFVCAAGLSGSTADDAFEQAEREFEAKRQEKARTAAALEERAREAAARAEEQRAKVRGAVGLGGQAAPAAPASEDLAVDFDSSNAPNLSPPTFQQNDQTLQGPFSSISAPIFASKYSFFSIFQYLQDSHTFAPLRIQNTRKNSSNFFEFLLEFLQKLIIFRQFSSNFGQILMIFSRDFAEHIRKC